MKKSLVYIMMVAITITFYGCPVAIDYPLGKPGTEKIDKGLIGTWSTEGDTDDMTIVKFKVEEKDDYSYKVTVLETGELYAEETMDFTGWVTELDGFHFIYLQPVGGTSYYLYNYSIDKNERNKFLSHDVGLLVNGTDGVTSTETYRQEVSASLKKADCLSEEILWIKGQ